MHRLHYRRCPPTVSSSCALCIHHMALNDTERLLIMYSAINFKKPNEQSQGILLSIKGKCDIWNMSKLIWIASYKQIIWSVCLSQKLNANSQQQQLTVTATIQTVLQSMGIHKWDEPCTHTHTHGGGQWRRRPGTCSYTHWDFWLWQLCLLRGSLCA